MSEPFIGEIKMVGFTFPPRAWADCNGQILPISQNSALFSLLGTIYGGDGRTSLGLPDLRSRMPMHEGAGAGLSSRILGSKAGTEVVPGVPQHTHTLDTLGVPTTAEVGNQASADGHHLARANDGENNYSDGDSDGSMSLTGSLGATGDPNSNNMPPFLTVRFIIALQGIFPS